MSPRSSRVLRASHARGQGALRSRVDGDSSPTRWPTPNTRTPARLPALFHLLEERARRKDIRASVVVRETDFKLPDCTSVTKIQDIYRKLVCDGKRNQLILNDVVEALNEGRSPILLTERRDHLDFFDHQLSRVAANLVVLKGGMTGKARREATERLATASDREPRLVLATGRFIGEGFDDARLDTLFLALPVSWRGTVTPSHLCSAIRSL